MTLTSTFFPPQLRPIITCHHLHHHHTTSTRFLFTLTSNYNNQKPSWILNTTQSSSRRDKSKVVCPHRLSIFLNSRFSTDNFHRSFWSCADIFHTSLCSLLQSRLYHFRSSFSSMTNTPQASAHDPPQSPSKTVRVMIKGRVQGVFYRDWTVENATQLGLKGWVRNRRDGSVEALFSGNADAVQEMEQRCRRGPPAALVTGLDVFPSNEDPGTRFERRQTA